MGSYPIATKRYWYPYGRVNNSSQYYSQYCSPDWRFCGLKYATEPFSLYSSPIRTRFFSWTSDRDPIELYFACEFYGYDDDFIEDFAPGDKYEIVITKNDLLKEVYIDQLWQRSDLSIQQWFIDTVEFKWFNFSSFLSSTPIVDRDPVTYDPETLNYNQLIPYTFEYISEFEDASPINIVTVVKLSGSGVEYDPPIAFPSIQNAGLPFPFHPLQFLHKKGGQYSI